MRYENYDTEEDYEEYLLNLLETRKTQNMSHSVPIKTMFKSQKSLFAALIELGWMIRENAKCRTYPNDPARNTVHQYVAVNPMINGYDVGFNVKPEEIVATCDFYGGSIAKSLGDAFCQLKKKYVAEVAREAGFEEQQIIEQFADGSLILEVDDGL